MSLEKINRIREHPEFNEGEFEAILVTSPENVLYVLGFKVESEISILIPKEDHKETEGHLQVFSSPLEYDEIKKNVALDPDLLNITDIVLIPPGATNFMGIQLKQLRIENLGFEDASVSVKKFEEWKGKYEISKFFWVSNLLLDARKIKTKQEIERIKKAADLGDIGFQTIYNSIEEGMTEKELAAEAEYEMRKAGGEGTSFDTIVASGHNSAFPHSTTSEKQVQDGDLIIVDIGSKYEGYCSDMTRTFIFGRVDPEKAELVNLVNDGQRYVLDQIKAGLICKEVDGFARDFFAQKKKEWSERFIHSLGHGVGVEIHENPYLSPISEEVLKENMIVTVEPGIYLPRIGGARTEDLLVIKENGYECLTHSEKYYY